MRPAKTPRRRGDAETGFSEGSPLRGNLGTLLLRASASLRCGGWFVACVLVAGAAGCGNDAPPPPQPAPPPAPQGPEPELPPLGPARLPEWAEVDGETPPEIPAPAAAAPLRWSFSEGRRYAYQFSQVLEQVDETAVAGKASTVRSRDRNRGAFEFVADFENTAKAALRIHTEESVIDGRSASREELAQRPPSAFECTVKEDGAAQVRRVSGQADAQIFFDVLLALGEGEKALKNGRVVTRLAGYRKLGRYECARLETEFELAPENASGKSLMRGRTVAYFALRERCFVRAATSVSVSLRSKGRTAKGDWATRAVDSRTSFRLELLNSPGD